MILAPRRVPDRAELDVLMPVYGYRFTRTGGVSGTAASRDPADIAAAEVLGWPVRSPEPIERTEVFERAIAAAAKLDEHSVLAAFVAGLGSAPRGRQTVISFAWARHLTDAPVTHDGLPDCGLDNVPAEIDITEELVRLALGWAWNELPYRYLSDLEAASNEGLPRPTEEDRQRLSALLDVIAAQPEGTRAGALEKAIAREKILPGTDKYQRYGILIGLAEFGLLPSTRAASWDRFVSHSETAQAWSGGPRSDVTPPLSGWRGGIDTERAARLQRV
ncbi:hypothetical protein KZC52_08650 [Microbacterium sp. kSW2-24]|uniref:hypothetical protein n=1 Tax=Microbacterium galbinum TaxID=2851646 RepID=UPI001FFCCFDB|nr:hypothetical protein [Microbacterium galbinum]MCK2022988.1 hypothetical protein [Microbacterium galbinum]